MVLAGAPLLLSGCLGVETTPEKSAKKAKTAVNSIAHQKGLTIGKVNAAIEVEDAMIVQDANGGAAVPTCEFGTVAEAGGAFWRMAEPGAAPGRASKPSAVPARGLAFTRAVWSASAFDSG